MATPNIAQKMPYGVEVTEGESYWWCACGKSQSQPFCDGSHKDTEFTPVEYKPDSSTTVYFLRLQAHRNHANLRRYAQHAIGDWRRR